MSSSTSPEFYSHSGIIVSEVVQHIDHLGVQSDGSIMATTMNNLAFFKADGTLDNQQVGLLPPAAAGHTGFYVSDFKVLANGSTVIGGHYYTGDTKTGYEVFRVTADGSIDPAFGNGKGWAGTPAIDVRYAQEMAIGKEGKIAIAGSVVGTDGLHLSVSVFTPAGNLDTAFGDHGSIVLPGNSQGFGVTVQSDGKIIVAGTSEADQGPAAAVYRFNVNGTLDTTFGDAGVMFINPGHRDWTGTEAREVTIQPDGKILIVGSSPGDDPFVEVHKFAVTRLNADGTLDSTFGTGGSADYFIAPSQGNWIPGGNMYASAEAVSLVVRQDGSIIIGGDIYRNQNGTQHAQFELLGLRANGSIDTSFGTQGVVTTTLGDNNVIFAKDLVAAPDGRLIIAGSVLGNGQNGIATRAVFAGYNGDGTPDAGFGATTVPSQNTVIYKEGHQAVTLNEGLGVRDAELDAAKSYQGAFLQLSRHGGANAEDQFTADAKIDGVIIGKVSSGSGTFRIDFNASASTSLVNKFLQSISYRNTADLVADKSIVIDWIFNDGSTGGALQAQTSTQVKLAATTIPSWIDGTLTALAADANPVFNLGTDHSLGVDYSSAPGAKALNATDESALNAMLANLAGVADLKFSPGASADTLSIISSAELAAGATAYVPLSSNGASIAVGLSLADGVSPAMWAMQQRLLQALGVQADGASDTLTDVQIATLQYLYGPSKSARTGDDTYLLSDAKANFLWDGSGNDTISAANITAGVTLHLQSGHWDHIGANGSDITDAGQITVNYGSVFENAIGGSGNDNITGTTGANKLQGGAGNDTLEGLGGSDVLDGGSGVDTAVYAGKRADFTIARSGSSFLISGASGKDTLTNVERVHFADADVALDIDGTAGQLFRLYQAIFDRKPDLAGLGWWLDAMDKGLTLTKAAELFAQAPEYKAMYGENPNNADLIAKLYEHALHRAPEADGLAWWKDILDNHKASLGEVLAGFSESPENYAQVIGSMQNGIAYIPFHG